MNKELEKDNGGTLLEGIYGVNVFFPMSILCILVSKTRCTQLGVG